MLQPAVGSSQSGAEMATDRGGVGVGIASTPIFQWRDLRLTLSGALGEILGAIGGPDLANLRAPCVRRKL